MQKFTKIVATIGPATETEEIMKELIEAGMNVARFNTKHGTPEWHQERIHRIKKVAKEMGVSIGVLLDLQGPEIRINLPGEQAFDMKKDDVAIFTFDDSRSDDKMVLIPQNVVETLQVGNFILLDDGACEFEIIEKSKDHFVAKALSDFCVKHRKTMNTPGITIDMPSIIPADLAQLDGAEGDAIDFVGLSFVRDSKDIEILRGELKKRGINAQVVAKIENQAAIDNLDEIIAASDAVMVARGDLAVEVPFEQLAFWQKLIITKCRFAGKPVITATQMLKSMVESPRPTRAEVTDIANAIYDNTSAVMLSEETTIGKYPVRAVATQAKIAAFNEQYIESDIEDWSDDSDSASITHAVAYMLKHRAEEIASVVCLSETGKTARLLSRFRPRVKIKGVTSNLKAYGSMSLMYGVDPFMLDLKKGCDLVLNDKMINLLKEKGIVESGQTVIVVLGKYWAEPGLTNTMSVVKIK
ncbi:MAG: pyruvate kinase [Patescibacteria group bacterium]